MQGKLEEVAKAFQTFLHISSSDCNRTCPPGRADPSPDPDSDPDVRLSARQGREGRSPAAAATATPWCP